MHQVYIWTDDDRHVNFKSAEVELFENPSDSGEEGEDNEGYLKIDISEFFRGDEALLEQVCAGRPGVNIIVEVVLDLGEDLRTVIGCKRTKIEFQAGARDLLIDGRFWKKTAWLYHS